MTPCLVFREAQFRIRGRGSTLQPLKNTVAGGCVSKVVWNAVHFGSPILGESKILGRELKQDRVKGDVSKTEMRASLDTDNSSGLVAVLEHAHLSIVEARVFPFDGHKVATCVVEVGQLCALPPGLRTKSDQGCLVENLLGGQEAVQDGAVDEQEAVQDGAGGLAPSKK